LDAQSQDEFKKLTGEIHSPGKEFVERLLIIDGHAYAYRAFHAIRELRSPGGQPTNAIFGFVKMLAKMRQAVQPTHLIVVWDGGLSAERISLLPEYKAQRPSMPDDLSPQLDEITGYLSAAGVASYCGDGVEADDYIACLARRAADTGMTVVIASSDKDFMQLVSPRIGLFNPNDKSEAIWTDEQVRGKAGVEPSQVVDWLSLMGDSVDNIPGVPGVGPKTAADLLKRFGSVSVLFGRLDEVKSEKLRAALRDSAEAVLRNQKMVRLQDDLPCDFAPDELRAKTADTGRLRELYQRWGFKGLLAALPGPARESQTILI
jgi:DNA polymerase I